MISVRLSDEEMTQLERVQVLLAKYWRRKSVEKAEAVRAGVRMLLAELEKQVGDDERPTRQK